MLIRLDQKVDALSTDIKDLKDNVASRVASLEQGKLDTLEATRLMAESMKIHDDHERRLRFVERYVWMAVGIIGLLNLIGFAYIVDKLHH